jgi:F-type H+-transporting ATPase subunit c
MSRFFNCLFTMASLFLISGIANAQEAAGGIARAGDGGWIAIAVALGIGIAAFGGAFGQGRAAAAALEGISRNPNATDKVFVPMILGLAFMESLVLFTWVLMLLMLLKL